jgi:hypothetical protein
MMQSVGKDMPFAASAKIGQTFTRKFSKRNWR